MRSLALAAALLLLGGCKAKDPFLGVWTTQAEVLSNPIEIEHRFAEGGKHSAAFELAGVKGTLAGTYVREGDLLTITPRALDLDTSGAILPKSMVDQGRAEIEKQLNVPQVGKVVWNSADSFTVTPDAAGVPPMQFKRAPEREGSK